MSLDGSLKRKYNATGEVEREDGIPPALETLVPGFDYFRDFFEKQDRDLQNFGNEVKRMTENSDAGYIRDFGDDVMRIIRSSRDEDDGDLASEQKLKISDLIKILEDLKFESGDLTLCVSDANSLFTLSSDNIIFELANKRNYDFAFGLNEEQYLSIKIE